MRCASSRSLSLTSSPCVRLRADATLFWRHHRRCRLSAVVVAVAASESAAASRMTVFTRARAHCDRSLACSRRHETVVDIGGGDDGGSGGD